MALKDSASNLIKTHLEGTGAIASLDAAALTQAKSYQAEIHLSDVDAAEIVRAMTQEVVSTKVEAASVLASARTVNSDFSAANAILREVLAYNTALRALGEALPGLGPQTLHGGAFGDKTAECTQLFKNFIASGTETGEFTPTLKEECAGLKVL